MRTLIENELYRSISLAKKRKDVVPRWRIFAPKGDFEIMTGRREDTDQDAYAVWLVSRLLIWKQARGYVLTLATTTDKPGFEGPAILSVGVRGDMVCAGLAPYARLADRFVVSRTLWLGQDGIDIDERGYRDFLPQPGAAELHPDELAAVLSAFGDGGTYPVQCIGRDSECPVS